MKTAIIIINYNNPRDTEKCLRSLSRFSPQSPVVVVDNASTTGDIDTVCRNYKNVKLLKNYHNLGFGRGNNVGIKWALTNTGCKYILILNNDAYLKDDAICLLEEYMDRNPQIDVCSPKIVFADDTDFTWYNGGEINWKRGGARTWGIHKKIVGETSPSEVTHITGCAMMLRKTIIERVGGFDPRYFIYVEDVELCARISRNGGRLAYLPTSVVFHKVHGSIKRNKKQFDQLKSPDNPHLPFYIRNSLCNHFLVLNTYAGGIERWCGNLYLAARWFRWCLGYIANRRFDTLPAIIKGFLTYWRIRKIPFYDEVGIQSDCSNHSKIQSF